MIGSYIFGNLVASASCPIVKTQRLHWSDSPWFFELLLHMSCSWLLWSQWSVQVSWQPFLWPTEEEKNQGCSHWCCGSRLCAFTRESERGTLFSSISLLTVRSAAVWFLLLILLLQGEKARPNFTIKPSLLISLSSLIFTNYPLLSTKKPVVGNPTLINQVSIR